MLSYEEVKEFILSANLRYILAKQEGDYRLERQIKKQIINAIDTAIKMRKVN